MYAWGSRIRRPRSLANRTSDALSREDSRARETVDPERVANSPTIDGSLFAPITITTMAAVNSLKRQRDSIDQASSVSLNMHNGYAPPHTYTYPQTPQPIHLNELWGTIASLPEVSVREMVFHLVTGATTQPLLQNHLHNMHFARMQAAHQAAAYQAAGHQAPAYQLTSQHVVVCQPVAHQPVAHQPVPVAPAPDATHERPAKRIKARDISFKKDADYLIDLLDDEHPHNFQKRVSDCVDKIVAYKMWPKLEKMSKTATEENATFNTKFNALHSMISIADNILKNSKGSIGCNVVVCFSSESDSVSDNMVKVLESMTQQERESMSSYTLGQGGGLNLGEYIQNVWNWGYEVDGAFQGLENVLELMGVDLEDETPEQLPPTPTSSSPRPTVIEIED